jgi:hypothetical protein
MMGCVLQMSMKLPLKQKEAEDVLSQEEQWANAQRTEGAPLTACDEV